ncbi:hypothetical protein RFI_05343 [Reticulomyxa filosa]|uniref:Endonuclease/exonuclease/phosphatase domain-containing protein n=1 Tax=Reticulomyxa filosa TaxID=46433 RepID=X6NZN7_RETFI|nr:hypothetical protein RFI_05343 [Reticulomyxa filosa]|eukprot:ETO31775.1 hypothetical protein RFI_05343 [Reticulomyxa filosa]
MFKKQKPMYFSFALVSWVNKFKNMETSNGCSLCPHANGVNAKNGGGVERNKKKRARCLVCTRGDFRDFGIQTYYMSTTENMKGYGNVIFSRILLERVEIMDFEVTLMERKLTAVQFSLNDNSEKFLIGTVHLESLSNNFRVRKEQWNQLFACFHKKIDLKNPCHFLIMGDFNQCATEPELARSQAIRNGNNENNIKIEELELDKEWSDCWLVRNKNELQERPGYTMPPTDEFPAWRPDRILYRFDSTYSYHT